MKEVEEIKMFDEEEMAPFLDGKQEEAEAATPLDDYSTTEPEK